APKLPTCAQQCTAERSSALRQWAKDDLHTPDLDNVQARIRGAAPATWHPAPARRPHRAPAVGTRPCAAASARMRQFRQKNSCGRTLHPVRTILFLALSNADIEAHHAVLIARAHHRNIAIDVVFALNDLLRTLRNVGAVSERDIIGELLLDGDLRTPRRGIGFRSQPLRIDLDPADSEKLLHAAAHSGIDRLA